MNPAAEAGRFLSILDPHAQRWEFRTFDDKGRGAGRAFRGSLLDLETDLAMENGKGRGVFVVVNDGGQRDEEIERIRAVFADFDKPGDLPQFPLEPHILVESSPGKFHAYWRVSRLPVADFKAQQQSIAVRLGSDPSVVNPSRVMRLPGYTHHKGEPFESRIIHESGAEPYTAEAIRAAFPPIKASTRSPVCSGPAAVVDNNRHADLLQLTAHLARDGVTVDSMVQLCRAEATRGRWTREVTDDEIERAARGAFDKVQRGEWTHARPAEPHGTTQEGLILVRGDSITPTPIDWLWNGYLAAGKPHIQAGPPGTGKTTVGLSLGATLTRGGFWPDGTQAPSGDFAIWSGEDDPEDVLVPRLIAMGADMARVHFIGGLRENGKKRSFDPARDSEHLLWSLPTSIKMLMIDPISAAVAGDSHKGAEVRRGLQPIVDAAQIGRFALWGVTHFAKGTAGRDPLERFVGSQAFGAVPRIAFVAARQSKAEGREERRVFLRAKSNIGPDGGGFVYSLDFGPLADHPGVEASRVVWGEALEGSARDILAEVEENPEDSGNDAASFLQELLQPGQKLAKDVYRDAENAGFSRDQMKRAKKKLRVIAGKDGMAGPWGWKLPSTKERGFPSSQKGAPFNPFDKKSAPFEESEESEGGGKSKGRPPRSLGGMSYVAATEGK